MNPYNNKNMLPHDSDMFFGRTEKIRRITDMIDSDNPQCVSIIGERRIGKSSLANRVFHRLLETENMLAVFLDCGELEDDCDTKEEFYQKLNNRFSEFETCLKGDGGDLFTDYSSFKRFVKKEADKGVRFAVFLDEFEKLPKKAFADDSFFSNLRALGNNPIFRLAFVTISKNTLKEMVHHKAIESSEFWNIFSYETLGLLKDEDIITLRIHGFKKNDFSLNEEELMMIDHYAGAFPFFNQTVCRSIFDAKVSGAEVNRDALEVLLMDFYEKLWLSRSKEEQGLLKELDEEKTQKQFSVKQMGGRGILQKVQGSYVPFSKHFEALIENHFKKESKFKMPTFDGFIKGMDNTIKVLGKAGKIKKGAQGLLPEESKEES